MLKQFLIGTLSTVLTGGTAAATTIIILNNQHHTPSQDHSAIFLKDDFTLADVNAKLPYNLSTPALTDEVYYTNEDQVIEGLSFSFTDLDAREVANAGLTFDTTFGIISGDLTAAHADVCLANLAIIISCPGVDSIVTNSFSINLTAWGYHLTGGEEYLDGEAQSAGIATTPWTLEGESDAPTPTPEEITWSISPENQYLSVTDGLIRWSAFPAAEMVNFYVNATYNSRTFVSSEIQLLINSHWNFSGGDEHLFGKKNQASQELHEWKVVQDGGIPTTNYDIKLVDAASLAPIPGIDFDHTNHIITWDDSLALGDYTMKLVCFDPATPTTIFTQSADITLTIDHNYLLQVQDEALTLFATALPLTLTSCGKPSGDTPTPTPDEKNYEVKGGSLNLSSKYNQSGQDEQSWKLTLKDQTAPITEGVTWSIINTTQNSNSY